MTEPIPPAAPPGVVPSPPPALNLKQLWIAILCPPVLTVIGMSILVIFAKQSNVVESLVSLGCIVVCAAALACWGLFINVVHRRFRGTSLVLLIIAYPILEGILVFGIFFVGCLATVSRSGIH